MFFGYAFFLNFIDKNISTNRFNKTPIIKDAILSNSDYNMFLLTWKGDTESYSVGNIELQSPYYACFRPVADTIEMFLEGAGKGTIIKHKNNRYNCGPIAVVIPESFGDISAQDRENISSRIPNTSRIAFRRLQNLYRLCSSRY